MQHEMHPLIQLVPDWMAGPMGKVAAFVTAGTGPLLAVADRLPPNVPPVVGNIITGVCGIIIALISWSAANARANVQLQRDNESLKTQIQLLVAASTVMSTATTASGNHLIPVTPPTTTTTPVGGTPIVRADPKG